MRFSTNNLILASACTLLSFSVVNASPADLAFCETAGDSFAADQVAQNAEATELLANANRGLAWVKSLRGDAPDLGGFISMLTGGDDGNGGDIMEPITEYGYSLVPFGGPPLVLFVLSILVCPYFFIARCCMPKSCCKPRKALEEYGICSRFIPLVFYFIFSTASVGLALYGILSTGNVVSGSVGGFCGVMDFLQSLADFFTSFQAPIDAMAVSLGLMSSTAQGAFDNANGIHTSAPRLVDQFYALGYRIGNVTFTADVDTSYFADTSSSVLDSARELDNSLGDALELFDSAKVQIPDMFRSVDEIVNGASETLGAFGSMFQNLTTAESKQQFDGVAATISTVLGYTEIGSYVFYSAVFIGFVAGVIAVLLYITPFSCDDVLAKKVMSCSWACTYLFMVFLFLLSGILIPVSFVMSDVCDFVTNATSPEGIPDLLALAGGGDSAERRLVASSRSLEDEIDVGEMFGGCFGENPAPLGGLIMDQLGIEDVLNVTDIELQIDEAGANTFDPAELYSFTNEVNNLMLSDMGVNTTKVNDLINELNILTGKSYTRADCEPTGACDATCMETSATTTCASAAHNPTVDATALGDVRRKLVDAIVAINEGEAVLVWMKADAAAINQTIVQLFNTMETLSTDIAGVKVPLQDLLGHVDSLGSAGECGFIGSGIDAITSSVCDEAIGGLGNMSITMFFIALFGIPMIILSVILQIRFFGTGSSEVEPMEYHTRDT